MNYNHILFIILLSFSLPITAQMGEQRSNWAIGINGGVNLNSVTFNPKIKENLLLGTTGGITARYISEKYFAMICGLQAELNFAQRGWDEKIENNTNTYSRTLNYIEFPFLAHLAFGKDRGGQFFLNLGPQLSYLISEKDKKSSDWDATERTNAQYDLMVQNKFDYGIVGGAGVEVRTKAGNFLLEGRYYFGLADIFNNSKKDYFGRSANTSICVKLSYLFDLTK
ncbi:MAG: porin family protein [Bacteroidaceae bacterium]